MAMGLERSHAESLGQGLLVVGCGLGDIGSRVHLFCAGLSITASACNPPVVDIYESFARCPSSHGLHR